jgi:RNA polymerase sigma-70 factor (ECF subfamily)
MPDPDQRLMRRFQKGDVSAFEVLLEKFQGPVLSLCRRYLGSRSPGVDDVAQEVFVRIFRSKQTYEPKAKVSTWIYRITVNTCLNEIRRLGADKNRNVAGFSAVFGDAESAGESEAAFLADRRAEAPLDEMAAGEVEGRVRAAIDALPEQQRLAVVLSRYHALPYEDVAAAMATSVPAVKSLLTRARENLRKALSPYVAGEPERAAAHGRERPDRPARETLEGRSHDDEPL